MKKIPLVVFDFMKHFTAFCTAFSSSNINCLFIYITKSGSNPFLSCCVLVSFPASYTQHQQSYRIISCLIHLTRTQGSSDSRNIYSEIPRQFSGLCVWQRSSGLRQDTGNEWYEPGFENTGSKTSHVSGKSIKIACSSHEFGCLNWSQWDLQRFTETQQYGHQTKISMCQSWIEVFIFIVLLSHVC